MTVQGFSYVLFLAGAWLLVRPFRAVTARQTLLLAASYVFYFSWGGDGFVLLIASSLMNFVIGHAVRRSPTRVTVGLGVAANVLLLALFKYLPPHAGQLGIMQQLVMPIGMSFWTFQAISYLVDLHRGKKLDPTLLEFCLYLAFWPTVLAGPICRLQDLLPQLRRAYRPDLDDLREGARRIVVGLFMKIVLAQTLEIGLVAGGGGGISEGFDAMRSGWGGIDVWLLAIGFGFQMFFDFAGYSHIVIGSARLFGFRLAENFDRPFLATTPSEFWTRWHMSLSSWIRDYVFLPLALVRREYWWRYVALVVAMSLFGLWHGAKATFVLWGAYQGLLLVGHRLIQQWRRAHGGAQTSPAAAAVSWGATFALMSIGWALFRAHDVHQAALMVGTLFSPRSYGTFAFGREFYVVTVLVVVGYFVFARLERAIRGLMAAPRVRSVDWVLSSGYYVAILLVIIRRSHQATTFAYFLF